MFLNRPIASAMIFAAGITFRGAVASVRVARAYTPAIVDAVDLFQPNDTSGSAIVRLSVAMTADLLRPPIWKCNLLLAVDELAAGLPVSDPFISAAGR